MSESGPGLGRRAIYLIQATALALFLGLCRALPVDWASALGGWIGRTIVSRMAMTRKAARNLARAFPANSAAENRRILLGMCDNLGRVVAEYPHLPRICASLEGGRCEVVGVEHFHRLAADPRPGVLFSAHLANWEVAPYLARRADLPLPLVYRAPNNPWVDRLLRRFRDAPQLIAKGPDGARQLLRLIRSRGKAGMLVDQKMNDGIAVPFFGRDAMTAPAIAQFALRLDCVLVPARTERLKGARFRVTVYPPLNITATEDRTADERAAMTLINGMIEDWVRERPEQWLWLHRRWPD
jgi:KDO2-lipid IV(A) lauroyltransferase